MDTTDETTASQVLTQQALNRLFDDELYQFDLVAGTVFNAANVRMIYLSSDIVRGIYEALFFEAGEAWKLILKNSGYQWGKRIVESFDKELKLLINRRLGKLSVREYIDLLENYFAKHGWGKVTFYLEDAPQFGIVRVSMAHSIFVAALPHVEDRVDAMIAGMLRGIFESISGQTLDCIEITCARLTSSSKCEFLISAKKRIENLEPLVERGIGLDAAIKQLREL